MLEIPILGRKVAVRYVSDKELATIAGDTDTVGIFHRNTIYLSTSLNGELAKQVLLHELCHAILEYTGLTYLFDDGHEDAVCNAFESVLELVRNKDLVKVLREQS